MINPYFTFTTDNKNFCCYKTSAILYISFYTDSNEKYRMQIQTTENTALDTIAHYTFKSKKYWDVAQDRWMDIMRAARNEERNNTNMKYYGSYGDVDPW